MTPFSIWIAGGTVCGLLWVRAKSPAGQAERWVDAGMAALAGCLVGARLLFAVLRLPYYSAHPLEILEIWQGGLAWPGAVLGGVLALALVALFSKTSFWLVCDRVAPLVFPLAIAAWMGCWQMGDLYGPAAPAGAWWGVNTLDENGVISARFPLQMVAAGALLLFFIIFEIRFRTNLFPGYTSAITGLILSLVMLAASLALADPAPHWLGLRVDTWAAGLFCLFFAFVGWTAYSRRQRAAN
jgi:prolipoprotein diacylglyceryltransferase